MSRADWISTGVAFIVAALVWLIRGNKAAIAFLVVGLLIVVVVHFRPVDTPLQNLRRRCTNLAEELHKFRLKRDAKRETIPHPPSKENLTSWYTSNGMLFRRSFLPRVLDMQRISFAKCESSAHFPTTLKAASPRDARRGRG